MNEKTDAERLEMIRTKLERTLANGLGGEILIIYTAQKEGPGRNGKMWLRAIVDRGDGIAVRYRYKTWERRWDPSGDKKRPLESLRWSHYEPWDGSLTRWMDWTE